MTLDVQTQDLGNAKLRLRSDLRFTLHRGAATQWYVVEDESRGQYFRIGLAENVFLSLLDGKRTLHEAQAELASIPGGFALDEQQVTVVAKWMIDSGLAESYASHDEQLVTLVRQSARNHQLASWMNPICWRIPLFNPDRLLTWLHRQTRLILGLPILFCWIIAVALGIGMLALNWQNFQHDRLSTFSTNDAFWLGVAWLAMKLLHESAHGLVCKHFGGRVAQFGFMIILFVPLPYVDVTSSWRFAGKFQRVFTAAAGMLAEGFVAACAAIVWCRTEPGPLQYHAGNLILAGSINTFIFNMNPLMRFDGYHILADVMDTPNLYSKARSAVKSISKLVLFGTRFNSPTEMSWTRRQFLYFYGVAAMLWQILACMGLAIAAANMFPGIGLTLVLFAAISWLGVPLWQLIRYLIRRDNIELPNRLRFFYIIGGGLGLASLLLLAPAPPTIRAPIVIQQDTLAVRAKTDGCIAKIHFESGQRAKQGDLLVTLVNPELEKQLQQTEIDLRRIRAQAACHLADGDIELLQLTQEHLQGLQNRHDELHGLVSNLKLRAEADGIVLLSDVSNLHGQFVHTGEELICLCLSNTYRAVALVAQADARWLSTTEGSKLSVMVWGMGGTRIPSTLTQVHPRASFDLPHAAFAATLGGEISVLDRQQANSGRDNRADSLLASGSQRQANRLLADTNSRAEAETANLTASGRANQSIGAMASGLRTVQPFVQVEITMLPKLDHNALKLYDGQTGILFVSSRRTTLGSYCAETIGGWISEQFTISHGL